jgi:hypothetical protein
MIISLREALFSASMTLVANPKHSKLEVFMHGTCLLICEHEAGMNVAGLGSRPLRLHGEGVSTQRFAD